MPFQRRLRMVPIAVAACTSPPDPGPTHAPTPEGTSDAPRRDAMMAGFAIHVRTDARDTDLPWRYDDQPWQTFLATSPLAPVTVDDALIESVTTDPLTLVLVPGVTLERLMDRPFIITLDGERLFAGAVADRPSARARQYPVIHVDRTGLATYVVILPHIGANKDGPVTARPELLAHFRKRGLLAPPGTRPAPKTTRRRLVAAVTATKPGDPTSQVDATCDDVARICSLTLRFRMPGSDASRWDQTETVAIPVAEFDDVWRQVEPLGLFSFDPQPVRDRGAVIHPPRYQIAVEADRPGAQLAHDRSWQTPSTHDASVQPFLRAVGELGRRHAKRVPVNYFP